MTYSNKLRPGMTAMAAVLALSATPAFAQEVTPAPATQSVTETAPTEQAAPAPVTSTPETTVTTTTTTVEPAETATAADPLAPAAATPVAERSTTRTTRTSRTARPSAPVAARSTAAPVATSSTSPVAAAPVADPVDAAPVIEPPLAAEPAPIPPATSEVVVNDDILPIAGAAGLGLLALGGAAFALRRRKRDVVGQYDANPTYDEPRMARAEPAVVREPMPAAAAAAAGASAFNWGDKSSATTVREPAPGAPGSHIAAAKRGPTPENPFLSLKKRLKRASFFEQRDRLVAQGKAKPLPLAAGLPERMASAARHVRDTVNRPMVAPRELSFNRRYQPA